jgi:hypothetical protein
MCMPVLNGDLRWRLESNIALNQPNIPATFVLSKLLPYINNI